MNGIDWFKDQKWGVFTHFLYHNQNKEGSQTNMGAGETSWNECVDGFDVRKLAAQLHEAGAHYLVFTLMQGSRYMCAPNETYTKITGIPTGEGCSKRDLIADLITALKVYDISLLLYYTGDGLFKDPVAGPLMGYKSQKDKVTEAFVENWASVAREYAMRYGPDVKGWWVDGSYEWLGYDDTLLARYAAAMKAGNPDAIVAFNNGVCPRVCEYSRYDDYTCGEQNDFVDIPDSRFVDGAQWHILAPIGKTINGNPYEAWCRLGCKRDADYMKDYVSHVNAKGGVVTIDVALYRDGHLDPEQMALLKTIR